MHISEIRRIITQNSLLKFSLIGVVVSCVSFIDFSFLSSLKIMSALIIITLLPGISVLSHLYNKFSLQIFLLSVTLSLCFWALVGQIFYQFHIVLSLRLIGIFIYTSIFFSLFLIFWRNFQHLGKIHIEKKKETIKIKKIPPIHINLVILLTFLLILAIFSSLRVPFVPAEDDWYHMAVSNYFLNNNFPIETDLYWGKISYHFIGSAYSLLSGLNISSIARFVGLVQLPLGAFMLYGLLDLQIKNKNVSILITVLFSVSILGTIMNFSQYWPTALSTLFGIQMYILFFKKIASFMHNQTKKRGNSHQKENLPEDPLLKNRNYFIFQLILGLSMEFTHIMNALIFIVPIFLSLCFITFRDRRFLYETGFYLILLLLNIVINPDSLLLFFTGDLFDSSSLLYLFLIGVPISLFVVWKFEKFIHKNTFSTLHSKTSVFSSGNSAIQIEKRWFRKIIMPIILGGISLTFILANYWLLSDNPLYFMSFLIEANIVGILIGGCILAILIYREYSIHGKINYLFLFSILFTIILFRILGASVSFTYRTIQLYIFIIFVGFAYYFEYNLLRIFQSHKTRKIILSLFVVHLFSATLYHAKYSSFISETESQFIKSTADFSQVETGITPEAPHNLSVMIIGGFRWKHPYTYYSIENQIYYKTQYASLLAIENQIFYLDNGTVINSFKELQKTSDINNFFLFFDESYLSEGVILLDEQGSFKMSEEEFHLNNNLEYINRVAVSHHKRTLYWIIL